MFSLSKLSRSARPRVAGLSLLVLVVSFGLAGCSEQQEPPVPDTLPSSVVNQPLYAFVSKARSAHHQADLAEQSGDRKQAIKSMGTITQGARPKLTPEVVEVLADAYARSGDLWAKEGDFDAGVREVDAGLALATTPTHFRGHLFEVKGLIEERRSQALRAKGQEAEADAAKERAIEAFQKAIEIQEQVIERALGGGDGVDGGGAPTNAPSAVPSTRSTGSR